MNGGGKFIVNCFFSLFHFFLMFSGFDRESGVNGDLA